jgi:8-oxo-dGTP diphosphatase
MDAGRPDRRIHVVAGILKDRTGRVLLAERRHDRLLNGFWEFPGGKVRPGETRETALCRELAEELGIEAGGLEHLQTLDHDYPDRLVRLDFFLVTEWRHAVRPLDSQKLLWTSPASIDRQRILPANLPIVDALLRGRRTGTCE